MDAQPLRRSLPPRHLKMASVVVEASESLARAAPRGNAQAPRPRRPLRRLDRVRLCRLGHLRRRRALRQGDHMIEFWRRDQVACG